MNSKIEEAKATCQGLHRLIRQMNNSAVDVDKGGASVHELLALLATTSNCISNLSTQIEAIESSLPAEPPIETTQLPSNITRLPISDDANSREIDKKTDNDLTELRARARK